MFEQQIAKANSCVDAQAADLCRMSDAIFDHPEIGLQEVFASGLLTDYLQAHGFQVEKGVGGLPTAFRAIWKMEKEVPIWGFCVNMMLCPVWAMAAAIRCRDRAFWGRLWPSSRRPDISPLL